MSYEPTEWKTGDVVTAAKLNKLENGVANAGGGGSGGGLIVHLVEDPEDPESVLLDKTWAELKAAVESGNCVYCDMSSFLPSIHIMVDMYVNKTGGDFYYVDFYYIGQNIAFMSESPDNYPKMISN